MITQDEKAYSQIFDEMVSFLRSLGITVNTKTKARGHQGFYLKNRIDISANIDYKRKIEVLFTRRLFCCRRISAVCVDAEHLRAQPCGKGRPGGKRPRSCDALVRNRCVCCPSKGTNPKAKSSQGLRCRSPGYSGHFFVGCRYVNPGCIGSRPTKYRCGRE